MTLFFQYFLKENLVHQLYVIKNSLVRKHILKQKARSMSSSLDIAFLPYVFPFLIFTMVVALIRIFQVPTNFYINLMEPCLISQIEGLLEVLHPF